MKLSQSIVITFSGLFLGTLITTTPAQAITLDEAFRLFGVWGRYYEDLQRTFNAAPAIVPTEPVIDDILQSN